VENWPKKVGCCSVHLGTIVRLSPTPPLLASCWHHEQTACLCGRTRIAVHSLHRLPFLFSRLLAGSVGLLLEPGQVHFCIQSLPSEAHRQAHSLTKTKRTGGQKINQLWPERWPKELGGKTVRNCLRACFQYSGRPLGFNWWSAGVNSKNSIIVVAGWACSTAVDLRTWDFSSTSGVSLVVSPISSIVQFSLLQAVSFSAPWKSHFRTKFRRLVAPCAEPAA